MLALLASCCGVVLVAAPAPAARRANSSSMSTAIGGCPRCGTRLSCGRRRPEPYSGPAIWCVTRSAPVPAIGCSRISRTPRGAAGGWTAAGHASSITDSPPTGRRPDVERALSARQVRRRRPGRVQKLSLSLSYRGGVVVYVNGQEVTRANLPKEGKIELETPAEDYPPEPSPIPARNAGPTVSWPPSPPAKYKVQLESRIRRLDNLAIEQRPCEKAPTSWRWRSTAPHTSVGIDQEG